VIIKNNYFKKVLIFLIRLCYLPVTVNAGIVLKAKHAT
jgi:hypothetical protein